MSKSSRGRELPPCKLPWFKLLGPVSCSGGAVWPPSARTSPSWPRLERLCGVRPMGSWPVTPEPTAPTISGAVGCEFSEPSLLQPTVRRGSRQPGGFSGAQMVRQQGFGTTTGQPPRAGPGRHRRFADGCRAHHPIVQNPGAGCCAGRFMLVSWSTIRRPATQEKGRATGDQGWHQPRRRPLSAQAHLRDTVKHAAADAVPGTTPVAAAESSVGEASAPTCRERHPEPVDL